MDKFDAMEQIRRMAVQNDLAVSVVTVDDVLSTKGIEEPTPEQVDKVVGSWEWRHYGDNWADWFEGFSLED
jgi:hypothetical protein